MLTVDQEMTLVEILAILVGIAVTWAIYYGSDRAELPGEATTPDPAIPDDTARPTGRTLE